MVKLMTVGNHISIGHPPCQIPTTCVTPANSKVTCGGSLVVNTGSPCTPHTFCAPEVHVPATMPTQTKVKVNGKFANTEFNPLSCGDLATVFLPSKVEILRAPSSAGGTGGSGGAGGSNRRLLAIAYLGGYPQVTYQESSSEFRVERDSNNSPYKFQEICRFPDRINITEAYTPILVSSIDRDPYEVKNYINVGAAGLPAYSDLDEPIKVDMQILGAYYFGVANTKAGRTLLESEFLTRKRLGFELNSNSIQIEDSSQNCVIKNVASLIPSLSLRLSSENFNYGFKGAVVIDYIAGLNLDGQSYFPSVESRYPRLVDGTWIEGSVRSAVITFYYVARGYC